MASGMDMLVNSLLKNLGIKPEEIVAQVQNIGGVVADFKKGQDKIIDMLSTVIAQQQVIMVALEMKGAAIQIEDKSHGEETETGK